MSIFVKPLPTLMLLLCVSFLPVNVKAEPLNVLSGGVSLEALRGIEFVLRGQTFQLFNSGSIEQDRRMWRFVLLFGGVMFVSQLIATSSIDYFTSPVGLRLEQIPVRALIFLITGVLAGVVLWFIGEHRYQKGSGVTPLSR